MLTACRWPVHCSLFSFPSVVSYLNVSTHLSRDPQEVQNNATENRLERSRTVLAHLNYFCWQMLLLQPVVHWLTRIKIFSYVKSLAFFRGMNPIRAPELDMPFRRMPVDVHRTYAQKSYELSISPQRQYIKQPTTLKLRVSFLFFSGTFFSQYWRLTDGAFCWSD